VNRNEREKEKGMKSGTRICDMCGGEMPAQCHRKITEFGVSPDRMWRVLVWRRKTKADGTKRRRMMPDGRSIPLMGLLDLCPDCIAGIGRMVGEMIGAKDGKGGGEGGGEG